MTSYAGYMLCDIVTDLVTNEVREGTLQEILYADDLVLITETMSELHKNLHLEKCN